MGEATGKAMTSPEGEPERLRVLRSFPALQRAGATALEEIAELAAALCGTPMAAVTLAACGTAGGSASSGGGPPPTPTTAVSVSPATASLFLGQTQQFSATVTGNSNTSVTWSVNGVGGGNSSAGTISEGGLYTAPSLLPSSASITIAATSQADTTASGSASV